MIRSSMAGLLLAHSVATSGALAQAIDSARVRTVYDAVVARRNEIERSNGRFADVDGIRIHYLEWGTANGVPLVWIPGTSSTAYELRSVAPQLVQAGYRVIAVESRGSGQTRVTDYEFSIQNIADDLVALLDHLQIRTAVFGGASMGGFIAAAVYDQHPDRVRGLLMADGGTWSQQWIFDHTDPELSRKRMEWDEMPPDISGASEFAVFLQMAGGRVSQSSNTAASIEPLLDLLVRINPAGNGRWAFLPRFTEMVGTTQSNIAGITRPTTLPLLQWSQHALIPLVVFRRLNVPMMILDPQEPNDFWPVTDQNERLARAHPSLVIHRVYPATNNVAQRPDWLVRDALELLSRVREGKSR
jgi:pimeloyl-ACP methyl ester carboxylesterase